MFGLLQIQLSIVSDKLFLIIQPSNTYNYEAL